MEVSTLEGRRDKWQSISEERMIWEGTMTFLATYQGVHPSGRRKAVGFLLSPRHNTSELWGNCGTNFESCSFYTFRTQAGRSKPRICSWGKSCSGSISQAATFHSFVGAALGWTTTFLFVGASDWDLLSLFRIVEVKVRVKGRASAESNTEATRKLRLGETKTLSTEFEEFI